MPLLLGSHMASTPCITSLGPGPRPPRSAGPPPPQPPRPTQPLLLSTSTSNTSTIPLIPRSRSYHQEGMHSAPQAGQEWRGIR